MKVVLHICCAVCAAGAAKSLLSERHQVLGFFYNPNIYPLEEYQRRLASACQVSRELDFPLEEGRYTPEEWLKATNHLAVEPEGGKRCAVCFELRLTETYRFMRERGWDAFTTTLTVGPRKPALTINNIGNNISGEHFLVRDFKKKDGFKIATALSKQWGLYRQNYCGCVYSFKPLSG